MRYPDFLILGAAKCGTTSLHTYLQRHPRIFLPDLKEPAFFSDDRVYSRGLDWYTSLFAPAPEGGLCGEASTTYTRWPHTADAADRIARVLPSARFVYIMRHPVDRAFSHYTHHMRNQVTMTFEEALERDSIYVDCGLYMKQIERYLRFFPPEAFLFLMADDLRRDPDAVVARICQFMEIEPMNLAAQGTVHANTGGSDYFIRTRTTRRLRALPGISRVADALPASWRQGAFELIRRSPIGRRLRRTHSLPPMKPETRCALLQRFAPANAELASFLGCDLGAWDA